MTRAFARSADRLAGWQSQLIAEAVEAEATLAIEAEHDAPADVPDARSAELDQRPPRRRSRGRCPASRRRPRPRAASPSSPTGSSRCSSTRGGGTCGARCRACSPTPTRSPIGLTKMRSVGFADLVNFTALVRRLSERDLARLVSPVRGAVGRRHHRPRRTPHQDGRRRGALHDRRRRAGGRHRARPRRHDDRGRRAARRALRHGPRPDHLAPRRRLRHHRQPRLAPHRRRRARAPCSSTRRWRASSRACRASSSPASAAACCAASGPSPRRVLRRASSAGRRTT